MTHTTPTGERRRLPEWLIGLFIAIVVVVGAWVWLSAAGAGDDPSFEGIDEPASEATTDGLTFTLWDGTPSGFEQFRGTPLVVNFWASWCPACIAEMPDFQEISAEFGDEVTFIGMNVQDPDRAAADVLVDQTGVEYQLASDPDGVLYLEFGGIAMPTTVFVDADGQVVDTHHGTIFADDLRERIVEVFGL